MNGKIYKITNIINGDSYVGQTIKEIDERFKQHKDGVFQSKRKHSKLQKAMAMYGIMNFSIELLEENIKTRDELSAKETYYIIMYDTFNQYNNNYGGGRRKEIRVLLE